MRKGSLTSNLFAIDRQNQAFYAKIAEKGNLHEKLFCIDLRASGKVEPEEKKICIDTEGMVKSGRRLFDSGESGTVERENLHRPLGD